MDPWLGTGIAVGIVAASVYAIRVAGSTTRAFDAMDAVRLVAAGAGAATSTKLVYLAYASSKSEWLPLEGEDRLYVVIGAVVLFAVSSFDAHRLLTSS